MWWFHRVVAYWYFMYTICTCKIVHKQYNLVTLVLSCIVLLLHVTIIYWKCHCCFESVKPTQLLVEILKISLRFVFVLKDLNKLKYRLKFAGTMALRHCSLVLSICLLLSTYNTIFNCDEIYNESWVGFITSSNNCWNPIIRSLCRYLFRSYCSCETM
jgi:hypothetical protein